MGNHGAITAGDIQWMTAGRGIIHQEMPKGDQLGRMHGFQLWANLPSALKMTAPRYQEVKAVEIPEATEGRWHDGAHCLRQFLGKKGPVEGIAADPVYLDVTVPPGKRKKASSRNDQPRLRICLRGQRQILQRIGPAGGADRRNRLVGHFPTNGSR